VGRSAGVQFGHPHKIPGGHKVLALGVSPLDAAVAALAQAARGLRPAEDLLDALAYPLADGVRRAEQDVQRHLALLARRPLHDFLCPQSLDKLGGVVALDRPCSGRRKLQCRFCDHLPTGLSPFVTERNRLHVIRKKWGDQGIAVLPAEARKQLAVLKENVAIFWIRREIDCLAGIGLHVHQRFAVVTFASRHC